MINSTVTNRATRSRISLKEQRPDLRHPKYVVKCETHVVAGPRYGKGQQTKAKYAQSHPWEWCSLCGNIYARHQEAKKKPKRIQVQGTVKWHDPEFYQKIMEKPMETQTLRISEAMAEIKLAVKKISTSLDFVMRNLKREDYRKDPFEKEGSTQEAEVQAAIQSMRDNQLRIVSLKSAINQSNMTTTLTVEGVTQTVAEWLIWRRDVLPISKKILLALANGLADVTHSTPSPRRAYTTPTPIEPIPNWVVNVSDRTVLNELQKLETIEERLDGALSVLNATTEIVV